MAGVRGAAVSVLFLTDGTTERFYVQLELREAFRLQKPVIMFQETDDRFGKPDYVKESKPTLHIDPATQRSILDATHFEWLFSEVFYGFFKKDSFV